MNPCSQAVWLTKEYRLEGTELRIGQQGSAAILELMSNDWPLLEAVCNPVDADFERVALEHPGEQHQPGPEGVFRKYLLDIDVVIAIMKGDAK
jgi:virulence-associated protein VagC